MTGNSLEYLTCFFNSKLFKFAFKNYFPELLGDTLELRKVFFENVAVKSPNDENRFKEILGFIDQNMRDKLPFESELNIIDEMIFDLYGLNDSERALILLTSSPEVVSVELSNSLSFSESE